MDNNELMHYGVLGMKWGVIRTKAKLAKTQRKVDKLKTKKKKVDELLREKKKLEKALAEKEALKTYIKKGKKSKSSDGDSKSSAETKDKKKTVKDMSDDELRSIVNRLQLERQYSDLRGSSKKRETFMDSTIKPALKESSKQLIKDFATKQGKKLLGLDESKKNDPVDELERAVKELKLEKQYEELTKQKKKRKNK